MYSSQARGAAPADVDDEIEDGVFEGDMSVFSDFQTAWGSRFPGCELPKAWEDDVRGNLAKHRHNAALLREELEKEEFYVEYLERLLADVERVVRRTSTTSTGARSSSDNKSHQVASGAVSSSTQSGNHGLPGNGAAPDGVATSASPAEDTSTPASNHKEATVGSAASADQYVTVITVSSYGEIQKEPRAAPREIDSGLIDNPLYQDIVHANRAKNWVSLFAVSGPSRCFVAVLLEEAFSPFPNSMPILSCFGEREIKASSRLQCSR